jgi:hypothetical protein
MKKDGTLWDVFFDGSVKTASDFIRMVKREHFFLVESNAGLIGMVRLNRVEKKKANIHYCTFSTAWGDPGLVPVAKWTVQRLLRMRQGESYFFDVFWGLCPVSNERGVRFSGKVASGRLGVLPNGLSDVYGDSMDAVLDYHIREEGEGYDENIYQSRG